MPNYPSSFDSGVAPGTRFINNVTSRRDFRYIIDPSVGSGAAFTISVGTAVSLPQFPVYSNSAGTITCGVSGTALTVDGYNVTMVGETVLVKNQPTATQNGVYTLTTAGATGTSWVLTRDTRFNTDGEIKRNTIFGLKNGTVGANLEYYISTEEPITLGTTNITIAAVPTTVTFNSAAKYPSDANVGIEKLGVLNTSYNSNFVSDFRSMVNLMQNDLDLIETSIGNAGTIGLQYMAANNILTINNLYNKMEKMVFEITRLREDVDRMNTVGFGAVFPGIGLTSAYPSSKNRLTNTAGGY